MPPVPKNILLLKSHSAGVGDLLRGSAVWRAILDRYPGTRLHLAFCSQEPHYISETLIGRHHLLRSFHVHPKWRNTRKNWAEALNWVTGIIDTTRSEMLIDFETNGIRALSLCLLARYRTGIRTVGIAEWPGRGWFYDIASPSRSSYAAAEGLTLPLEYSERDFVALAGLGIRRQGTPIEIEETPEAVAFRKAFRSRFGIPEGLPLVGINVGCGTPGADCRRPDGALIEALIAWLQETLGCAVVLTGAPFESATNQSILQRMADRPGPPRVDAAGKTSLVELPGLIRACDLFISSDSGPYHIGVGLRVPTVALFNFEFPVAIHRHPWVRCVVCPSLPGLPEVQSAVQALRASYPWRGTPHAS